MIKRLCVIGVGLIGGSLARALREAGAVDEVIGCGRGEENLRRAQELGVIDDYSFDPREAVADADMIVVATNLGATGAVLTRLASALSADTIITDVGSAKVRVIEAAREALGPAFERFVPGHPIAGAERSGVEASFGSLFQDHRVILTPVDETAPSALDIVDQMWRVCGAKVSNMDASGHDQMLAATSHLPHMLAFAFVDCLAQMESSESVFDFAGGGFRDFSRIASSNPEMWCDIAFDNRKAILAMMARFGEVFSSLDAALQVGDRDAVKALFERAKNARDQVV